MNLSTKRNQVIILIALFVFFAAAGGYLLWRVNQPETVAPEDSDASTCPAPCVQLSHLGGLCTGPGQCVPKPAGGCKSGEFEHDGWLCCDICDLGDSPGGRECACGTDVKYCSTCTDWNSCLARFGCCDCHGWKATGSCYDCKQYSVCGTLNGKVFPSTTTRWPSGTFCGDSVYGGTPSPSSPSFPAPGQTTNWTCNAPGRNTNCSARTQALASYTVTYNAGTNGTIQGTRVQTVTHGGSTSAVTAVPSSGYYFGGWSDGKSVNPRTDSNVTGNITVTASFSLSCGNGVCEANENAQNCPADCDPECGDGFCTHEETVLSCPDDCESVCGDGYCTHDENNQNCPEDCSADCGDGYCNPETETAANCPADCDPVCGDGFCTHDETPETCPQDCGSPHVPAGPVVPQTGIFDDTRTAVMSGLLLLFLGFTWRFLGRGMYISVEFLGRIPKKLSIHMKDVKEDLRMKKRIGQLRKTDQRRRNFEKKVVKH
jgi:hypothetical protein